MSQPKVKILSVQDVADMVGWNIKRTRRLLQKHAALKCSNPGASPKGRKYYTTLGMMRQALPEVWAEVAPEIDPSDWEDGLA